jgi:hypothetical protein
VLAEDPRNYYYIACPQRGTQNVVPPSHSVGGRGELDRNEPAAMGTTAARVRVMKGPKARTVTDPNGCPERRIRNISVVAQAT